MKLWGRAAYAVVLTLVISHGYDAWYKIPLKERTTSHTTFRDHGK